MVLVKQFVKCLAASVRYYNKNHYEILRVNRNATSKEIKDAYLKLSDQFHPDKNPTNKNAHEKFVKISEAYSVLSKIESKEMYDKDLNKHSLTVGQYINKKAIEARTLQGETLEQAYTRLTAGKWRPLRVNPLVPIALAITVLRIFYKIMKLLLVLFVFFIGIILKSHREQQKRKNKPKSRWWER